MKASLKISFIVLFAVAIAACSKQKETGVILKAVGTNNSYQYYNSAVIKSSQSTAVISSDAQFTFTEALLGISKIEIESRDKHKSDEIKSQESESEGFQGENENEFEFKGSYLIDLLKGTSDPEPGFATLDPGVYTNFEAKTARMIDGNKTVSIKGSFTDVSAKTYKFEFSTTSEIEFEYESENGFALTEGHILDLILKINLPTIFAEVDFSNGVLNGDNVIVINETSNTDLFYKIKSNLRNMAEMDEENDD